MKGVRVSNWARFASTWVSGECEGTGGKWKDFLILQGLFFHVMESGEVLVYRFQLNMMDQTVWQINTILETPTWPFSLLVTE